MIRFVQFRGAWVFAILALSGTRTGAQVVMQQNPSDVVVMNSTNVFAQAMVMPQNEIPRSLLAEAQAIAIVPSMVRGAFVFGVQYGRGVLVLRGANGAWQPPRFIQMTGGSFGYQIGVQATDLVLVFRTQQSVQNLLRGTMKVGVDASAAAGPVGRQTSAATDLQLQAEILSYSRARGAFVGVSIDGSVISLDPNAEAIYYQANGAVPASTVQLLQQLAAYSAVAPVAAAPGQAAATGWVAAGQGGADAEAARKQLDQSSRRLLASPTLTTEWRNYLALPPEVYTPNAALNAQSIQQAASRYEEVSRRPEFAALNTQPDFQETLRALKRVGEVRTASNTTPQLPPPPR